MIKQSTIIPYWVDIDFPIIIRTTGVGIPTLEVLQGNITAPQWQVNDVNVCEGQELIHGWKEGTDIYWHVHIVTNGSDSTNRYVNFEIEYCFSDLHSSMSDAITITSGDFLIQANTADKTHLIVPFAAKNIPANIMGHVWARLKRIDATGTAPTANPWCSMLQMHILCDTVGSRLVSEK